MAGVHRLIVCRVLVALMLWLGLAAASEAAAPLIRWKITAMGSGASSDQTCFVNNTYLGSTPGAALQGWLTEANRCQSPTKNPPGHGGIVYNFVSCPAVTVPPQSFVTCSFTGTQSWDNYTFTTSGAVNSEAYCDPDAPIVNGQCPDADACAQYASRAPTEVANGCTGAYCSWFSAAGPDYTKEACLLVTGGPYCTVTGDLSVAWGDDSSPKRPDGYPSIYGVRTHNNKFTGTTCNPSADPTVGASSTQLGTTTVPLTPITPDRVGKCPGTVNGVEVWVPCSTTVTPTKSTTTQGSGSATVTVTNSGSTTCKDGICTTTGTTTTTVTSSTPEGSTTSTTTATGNGTRSEGMSDFCKDNPKNAQCGDQGTFGGTCDTAFACTGDAVMCAAAKAVNETKCKFFVDPLTGQEALLYESSKVAGTATGIVSESVALSSSSFDQTNALGVPGQCITDQVVTVWGKQLSLPFSQVCPHLAIAGQLLLALSFLIAIRIVGRG